MNLHFENQNTPAFSTTPNENGAPGSAFVPQKTAQKPTVQLNKKDGVFFLIAFLSAFLISRFGFFGGMNLGFSIAAVFAFSTALGYTFYKGAKNKPCFFVIFVLTTALCVSFSFNDDALIKFCDVLFLIFLSFVTLGGLSGSQHNTDGGLMFAADALSVGVISTAKHVGLPLRSLRSAAKDGKHRALLNVLIGLLIALPLICVILPLLSSSDMAFEGLLKTVFTNLAAVLVSLLFAVLFTPFKYSYELGLAKGLDRATDENRKAEKTGKIGPALINTVLAAVAVCYAVYLFSQLAYIAKAFAFLLPADYSTAEFARRGFFEMTVIAFINLVLIAVCGLSVEHREGKLPFTTKILLIFLNCFTLFFIISAFSRMAQYISLYGLTRLRVLTSVFMAMLFVIFVILLLRLFLKKLPYMKAIIIVCGLTLLSVSFCDVNTVIAKYNYNAYLNGKITVDTAEAPSRYLEDGSFKTNLALDVDELGGLGKSALPELSELSGSKDPAVSILSQHYIYEIALDEYDYHIEDATMENIGIFEESTVKQRGMTALNEYFKKYGKNSYKDIRSRYQELLNSAAETK